VLTAVIMDGVTLQYVDETLRNDPVVQLAAEAQLRSVPGLIRA